MEAKPAEVDEVEIDEALNLQMISVRLQQTMIDDLKLIGGYRGIGYQTAMKMMLKKAIYAEFKGIIREVHQMRQED